MIDDIPDPSKRQKYFKQILAKAKTRPYEDHKEFLNMEDVLKRLKPSKIANISTQVLQQEINQTKEELNKLRRQIEILELQNEHQDDNKSHDLDDNIEIATNIDDFVNKLTLQKWHTILTLKINDFSVETECLLEDRKSVV